MTTSQITQMQDAAERGTLTDAEELELLFAENYELQKLDNTQLVAYWNICQMSAKCLGGNGPKNRRHSQLLDQILTDRGIPHAWGKTTSRKLAA